MSTDISSFIAEDAQMNMHVLALLTTQVDQVAHLIDEAEKLVIGETSVFLFKKGKRTKAKAMLEYLLENSIAYNYGFFDQYVNRPDYGHFMRYAYDGEQYQRNCFSGDTSIASVVVRLLEDVGCVGDQYQAAAFCYAMDTEWGGQETNGKMHQMRKLIGGM